MNEGGQAVLDLNNLVNDHDLTYLSFTDEKLTFSGTDENWESIDADGIFTADLRDTYNVVTRTSPNTFSFICRVTDKGGFYSEIPMTVAVNNVNRQPLMETAELDCIEGNSIEWETFQVSDRDEEDTEDTLAICFMYADGTLYDKGEQP